jgi:8-oxo-dGTP diphosphatase
MKIKNTEIELTRAHIGTVESDAAVLITIPELTMEHGLAGKLAQRGGSRLVAEALKQAPVAEGGSVVTTGGDLASKNVIHAVGCRAGGITDEVLWRAAIHGALVKADAMCFHSIVFSAPDQEISGVDTVGATKILAQECYKICCHRPTGLKKIMVCVSPEDTEGLVEKTLTGYLRHLRDDLGPGPYVTVDVIIEISDDQTPGSVGIVIIERSNPPYGLALPGGFVDYGESLEKAVRRESMEETALELETLRQFHTYSAVGRDPRFQTISTVFIARGRGTPCSGDDAKSLRVIPRDQLMNYEYAFDHQDVLRDYLTRNDSR